MLSKHCELLGMCLWAAMALVAVGLTDNVALRAIACAPLILLLPGYALLRALGFAAKSAPEWYTLGVGLSIAIAVISGFVLNAAHLLTPLGWAAWLNLVIATASFAAVIRGTAAPSALLARQTLGGLTFGHVTLIGVAALVAAGAFAIVVADEHSYRQFHYTEFWMLPGGPERPNTITIGVKNAESGPSDYDIEVMLDGRTFAVWRSLPLDPGHSLTKEIAVPLPSGRAQKAEAWLFKSGNRNLVYRKVSVVVDGG
jgi:uncharacterized membrane protein